jgi:hypothetical protein
LASKALTANKSYEEQKMTDTQLHHAAMLQSDKLTFWHARPSSPCIIMPSPWIYLVDRQQKISSIMEGNLLNTK